MKGDFSRDTFDSSKHYSRVLMQQGRVQLDADWNEQQSIDQYRMVTEAWDVIGVSGAPLHNPGFKITTTDGKTLIVGHGRYYVDGYLCENESDIAYTAQPDLPNPPDIIAAMTSAQATSAIIYLDVWSRHVTGLDDPLIRETALGGPDTATRVKTVWQIKALVAKPDGGGGFSCGDSLKDWDNLTTPSSGMLSARAQPTQPTDSPCLLPPSAGYRRLENQLYRVEVHTGGNLGAATFKWSRDNGAVVTSVDKINGQDITVHDLGRDDALGFSSGQWVEIRDDVQELTGNPGQLVQIDHIDTANRVISVKQAVTGIDAIRRPKLRRWDGASTTGLQVVVPTTNDGWIPLEDGVEVQFATGTFVTGDYWLIPARAATGNVEWPFTSPQQRRGIGHHYARLAVASLVNANSLVLQDCRKIFFPLAEQPPALHVTGINWVNDDVVSQDLITNGLQVFFDSAVTLPATDSNAAIASLTLDMPLVFAATGGAMDVGPGDGSITGQTPMLLDGDISFPTPATLQWKPTKNGAEFKTLISTLVSQRVSRVRLRFNLKGHTIWQEGGANLLYLDGHSFGQKGTRADTTSRIDLLLPSGDGRRSSDFESWFFLQLQLPASSLVSLTLDASSVLAGGSVNGTVMLDFPAGTGGSNVVLTSSSPAVTFPSSPNNTVNVPAGHLQASFPVKTGAIASSAEVLIGGTLGSVTKQAKLVVQVISVAISPPALGMFTGRSQQFTATVAGTDNTPANAAVTWSIQEANGGSINSSGLYVAPAAVGTFHVIATSVVDNTKTATATVTITLKPKEKEKDKEKEHKDKDKEKDKEIHGHQEFLSEPGRPIWLPNAAMLESEGDFADGRAFIRPAERPSVAL
jgi:prepilin-type processing-associated H-X9-DG protein